jgi:hypothetical protein
VVLVQFSREVRSKRVRAPANLSCSGEVETSLTLFYSGLEVSLLGSGKGRSLEVYSFIVTSPKWSASGVNIGADIKQALVKFRSASLILRRKAPKKPHLFIV